MEGADCVAGQLRGDKECPFSGVTKSGRVWRKLLESDAWSVIRHLLLYTLCTSFHSEIVLISAACCQEIGCQSSHFQQPFLHDIINYNIMQSIPCASDICN